MGTSWSIRSRESRPISPDFTVVPLREDTASFQLTQAFLESATWSYGELAARARYCAEWVPRFYSSGFLPVVFLASGSNMRTMPLDELLSALRTSGTSDIVRAEILEVRLVIHPGGDELRALLEEIADDEPAGPTAAIIATWAARAGTPKSE
jgi:hypothetical protein